MTDTPDRPFKFDTLALHAGQTPDPTTGASAVPIYQTASYEFRSTEHAAALFNLEATGNIYTRIMNPTNDVFEARMAALEGGAAAVATSSGHAAEVLTLLTLAGQGDDIISATNLYGGTYTMFTHTLPRLGVSVCLVDQARPDNFAEHITPNTKAFYFETIGNPALDVPDFQAICDIAHAHGIPVVVDNTFATPYLCRVFEHGADIAVHSVTKWLSGHGLILGGVVVDGGTFDWAGSGRFPQFTRPEPAYHGVSFVEHFGPAAFAARARTVNLRDFGPCQAPFNSFLALIGLETLPLRMQRHCENAQAVAEFLETHALVSWVRYPGLPSHPTYAHAQKYLRGGAGGMVGFGVRGGREAGARFIDNLKLMTHLANVGDARSLAIHPASTTHSQLSDEEQRAAGVSPDFIRLSIGLEDIEDILWDLDQALRASQQ